MAPMKVMRMMMPMKEMTRPAMAKPRGALNTPIKEKITPSNQRIQSRMGIQQRMRPMRARTKPAVPIPFDLGGWGLLDEYLLMGGLLIFHDD